MNLIDWFEKKEIKKGEIGRVVESLSVDIESFASRKFNVAY